MACAAVLEPNRDFPAWLEAQGVNEEVARAMDSELGIRDYGVLCACVGDGLVRAELLAAARDRLPFGFYAVLRQVVKALRGAGPGDRHDDAAASSSSSSPGDVTLGGLVDALLALLGGLSRELVVCARRLGDADGGKYAAASPSSAGAPGTEILMATETSRLMENDEPALTETLDVDSDCSLAVHRIKAESPRDDPTVTQTLDMDTSPSLHFVKVEQPDGDGFTAAGPTHLGFQNEVEAVMEYRPCSSSHSGDTHGGGAAAIVWPRAREMEHTPAEDSAVSGWSQTDRTQMPSTHEGDGFIVGPSHLDFQNEAGAATEHRPHSSQQPSGETSHVQAWRHADHVTPRSSTARPSVPPRLACGGGGGAGGSPAREKEKPYSCKVCTRAFSQKVNLQVHMRVHTGEKPYRCDLCDVRFMMKPNLIVHQRRVHTGEKPYHCEECGLDFFQHCTLIRHLRTHAHVEAPSAHNGADDA